MNLNTTFTVRPFTQRHERLPGGRGNTSSMSALGQKQTFAMQIGMSALPPKADMCGATRDVRFVPKADINR